MNAFEKMFEEKRFVLIVSLPDNTVEMAEAARDGGADCTKVHTSVIHAASGKVFGPLEDQKDVFSAMIHDIKIPTGVVPGRGVDISLEEIKAIDEMGFLFVDNYSTDFSPKLFQGESFGRMCAITRADSSETIREISARPIDVIEADVVPHEGYGRRLSLDDLAAFRQVVRSSYKPVIVPTQRKITPEDVPALLDCGLRGLMIGVVVTGNTAEGVRLGTEAYRRAIDALV